MYRRVREVFSNETVVCNLGRASSAKYSASASSSKPELNKCQVDTVNKYRVSQKNVPFSHCHITRSFGNMKICDACNRNDCKTISFTHYCVPRFFFCFFFLRPDVQPSLQNMATGWARCQRTPTKHRFFWRHGALTSPPLTTSSLSDYFSSLPLILRCLYLCCCDARWWTSVTK